MHAQKAANLETEYRGSNITSQNWILFTKNHCYCFAMVITQTVSCLHLLRPRFMCRHTVPVGEEAFFYAARFDPCWYYSFLLFDRNLQVGGRNNTANAFYVIERELAVKKNV